MKLDTKAIRYLTAEDWRVLTAVEMGSKNHELVPTKLIGQLSGLRNSVHRNISNLAKVNLIAKIQNAKYDGYRLTYGGLDYLALNTHRKSTSIYSVGNQIGVGKESDIYVVASAEGIQRVLKIHRLGRISFRTVKANRDYLRNRTSGSWMYMSRLAALKEFAIMKALHENDFPVPVPVAQSRHTIVMSLINAFPLRQISSVPDPAGLYAELLALIVRLAGVGLIHGDYNEFNILIEERKTGVDGRTHSLPDIEEEQELDALGNAPMPEGGDEVKEPAESITLVPTIIDFPQMVSIDHPNAQYYFDRDVACIKRFFSRRFHFTSDDPGPFFAESIKVVQNRLDIAVEASGFSRKMAKELDAYMKEVGADGVEGEGRAEGEEEEDDSEPEEGLPVQPEVGTLPPTEDEDVLPSQGGPVTAANLRLLHSSLVDGMEVLDIQDGEAVPELVPAVAPSVAPSTFSKRGAAKAAAGWSI
ncbi:hypothetical protein BU16DRAFT_571707 [Lophium mytilinum]|uniref:Serine/threonine-protein kinase RIO2 n=1 Tax=Lophium mytilinum TaxID=390894 RepID=A0A6A6QXT0_9PEZI|nr:hypothetical protein BU16DRAFT_571707 [Lophium mytilinum]